MTHMSSDTDAFQYFKKSSTIYQDEQFIRRRMAGDDADPRRRLRQGGRHVQGPRRTSGSSTRSRRYAKTLPHVTKVISHADHIKLMNQALMGGEPATTSSPATKEAVEQYLLLHNEPDDFHLWIDSDYRMRRASSVRMDTMSSTMLLDNRDEAGGVRAQDSSPAPRATPSARRCSPTARSTRWRSRC